MISRPAPSRANSHSTRRILPRTALTDLAELMVRHPRVLNYSKRSYSDFRAELARLLEFIAMLANPVLAIVSSIYRPGNWW